MKRLKTTLTLVFVVILISACASVNNSYTESVLEDTRRIFVGTWKGKYVDHKGRLSRTWIQNRLPDGTYTITFIHHTQEGIYSSKQEGKWWVDGDRFYEIAPNVMEEPDVYQFEILNENEIHFRSIAEDYEFIDKRMQELRDATFI